MEPPTPRPELFEPSGTGSLPPIWRGSVQYSVCAPRSSETQSVSGSQNGPASRPTHCGPAARGSCSSQRAFATEQPGVLVPGPLDPVGERHRIGVAVLGTL